MKPSDADPQDNSPLRGWALLSIAGIAVLLSLWTWQKWDAVWIDPSEAFFPPEWSNEDLETLAWKYPVYRSNDSYQWVHLADALAEGNSLPLHHRFDEGPPEGRPNRWHSGLAYLLSASGSLVATVQDWPADRARHHSAHWLGVVIQLGALLGGSRLISHLAGRRAALLFAALFFLNAAIAWDFAYSRLDHEAVFQFFFLFHLVGLAGLLHSKVKRLRLWATLAGVAAGACWWVSATVMAALSIFITLGLLAECARRSRTGKDEAALARGITTWGGTAALSILLFSILDGRLAPSPSIATLHPVFLLAQVGAALACLALLLKAKRLPIFAVGLFCSLIPLAWLAVYGVDAHPWLNPMMRRLHDHIVEFQSPFVNGLWPQAETLQAFAIAALALLALFRRKPSHNSLFLSLTIGLLLLAALQTRWLGLLGTVGVVGLCLQLRNTRSHAIAYLGLALLLLSLGSWIYKWNTIEKKPGQLLMTDLALQIGARDINLNLQRLSGGETIHVAMPYAFAATSALFPEVHPIGTFYWENAEGIEASANFFAGLTKETPIDFAVVQGGRQGAPFAKMVNWVARADVAPGTIESSPAWQLSVQANPTGWAEVPFYGTFGSQQFAVRIFKRETDRTPNIQR
jgi:hypothetical protein